MHFTDALAASPLIAILRGLSPDDAIPVSDALLKAGFQMLEVPLNRPGALDAIRKVASHVGGAAIVGAGTVLDPDDVPRVADAGGTLIISPNCNSAVIRRAKAKGLVALPGVATPTEAFAALDAGADGLKLFPAEGFPPAVIKAWRAILPAETAILPVGGITPENIAAYLTAGATGFGIGSSLYVPGKPASQVHADAVTFMSAMKTRLNAA
jgi:2-dehydro-3-deoxyphosphogalactonate aldolase